MAYKQVLNTDEAAVDFTVKGQSLLLLTNHSGGTWSLDIIAPDGEVVPTGFTGGGANFQQRLIVPSGTTLRLHGGTAGARAYVGQILTDTAGVHL